ncbi:MAG: putative ABC transporter ATP-binding protein [Firmicutes bacterium ADurb.Bin182]|nr:MAG: putative ABC transporter ATP-binding protein [Firmicutes bacterium ADurb.Bin182]
MKLLFRFGKEAIRYKFVYIISVLSTFALTVINLTAPKVLSEMTSVVERGVTEEGIKQIGKLTAFLIGLYLIRILFRYLSSYLSHKAAWHLVGDLRAKMYDKLQSFSMSFFQDKQTGDLMSRVINDTRDFELLYAHSIPDMITNIVTVLGVMIVLLSINWKLALLTCLPIPFVLLSGTVFVKKVQPHFKHNQKVVGQLNAKLQDNLSGIHEIQAFVKEEHESKLVHEKVFENVRTMLKALNASAIFHPSVEFLSSAGTIIVVGAGGWLAYTGELFVADIVAFILYLSLFYAPISGLGRMLEEIQQTYAGAERAALILDTPVEITDAPDAVELKDVKGSITFENVSFQYDNNVPVLKNISFSCAPGQMIALVGPTGVGKTTMTSLISRLYEPTEGAILIDGQDIKKATVKSLRSHIAPVLQDTFLFNASIADNIRYADFNASMEDVISAAKAANIHADIMSMPEKYDTKVGERGLRLSGGQKQRIAIARAILRNSPIVILDEATASVDVETEKEIQKAINELAGTRTIVVIAHRLSTVRNADIILVIEDGRITEKGNHEQLLKAKGTYWRMYEAQKNGLKQEN